MTYNNSIILFHLLSLFHLIYASFIAIYVSLFPPYS